MSERIFLDTNIIIDLLGEREPFYLPAARIATLADRKQIKIYVSALSYPTVFYVLLKFEAKEIVTDKLRKFKIIANTSNLTDAVIEKALISNFRDFEDGLQYHCALHSDCNILITRNEKDFINAALPVMTPREYLKTRNY